MDVVYFSYFYSFNLMLLLYDILIILISFFNFDEYFILWNRFEMKINVKFKNNYDKNSIYDNVVLIILILI